MSKEHYLSDFFFPWRGSLKHVKYFTLISTSNFIFELEFRMSEVFFHRDGDCHTQDSYEDRRSGPWLSLVANINTTDTLNL